MMDGLYPASRINRRRSTKDEMASFDAALVAIVRELQPVTVRGAYYAAEVRGLLPKTDAGYDKVGRHLVRLRLEGRIPFSYIADNTRWMRKPDTFTGIAQALKLTAQTYRRALWNDAPVYVEVWCEKDALAGVLVDVTAEFDVTLMVARGFSSITYLHNAAAAIAAKRRPAYVYHFGDYDPSGIAAAQAIERRLREFAPKAEIHFERVAVTPGQIELWNLPTRSTKASDSRARGFSGYSVELDAIPAPMLRALARDCIEQHVDERMLSVLLEAERSERDSLAEMARIFGGSP